MVPGQGNDAIPFDFGTDIGVKGPTPTPEAVTIVVVANEIFPSGTDDLLDNESGIFKL